MLTECFTKRTKKLLKNLYGQSAIQVNTRSTYVPIYVIGKIDPVPKFKKLHITEITSAQKAESTFPTFN